MLVPYLFHFLENHIKSSLIIFNHTEFKLILKYTWIHNLDSACFSKQCLSSFDWYFTLNLHWLHLYIPFFFSFFLFSFGPIILSKFSLLNTFRGIYLLFDSLNTKFCKLFSIYVIQLKKKYLQNLNLYLAWFSFLAFSTFFVVLFCLLIP